jgi:hypothetical protein
MFRPVQMNRMIPYSSSSSSFIATNGQAISSTWCRAPFGEVTRFHISLSGNFFLCSCCRAPSLATGRVWNLQCNYACSSSSCIATDGQSFSPSWSRAPFYFSLFVNYLLPSSCRVSSPISPMNTVVQPKVKVKSQRRVSVGRDF